MEIKINVEVGLNQKTTDLTERLINALERIPRHAPAPAPAPQPQPQQPQGPAPQPKPQPQPAPQPQQPPTQPQQPPTQPQQPPTQPQQPAVTATPAPRPAVIATPAPQPPAPQPQATAQPMSAIPDDQTMRTMMDIAISRVCGTVGWKESQDPFVIDIRRSCTSCFREISAHLGAEKPTLLQGEKRNQFLRELENIYVDVQNRRALWQAF